MKLYARWPDILLHPILYFKWRRYAMEIWKTNCDNDVESFKWYIKYGL